MAAAFAVQFGTKPGTGTAVQAAAGASFGPGYADTGEASFGAGSSATGLRYTLTALGIPIPSYDVGTPYVAANQLAFLHQGERVLTRAENHAFSQGGGSEAIAAALRESGVPDAQVQQIIDGWPKVFTSARAVALGFSPDASADVLVQSFLAQERTLS